MEQTQSDVKKEMPQIDEADLQKAAKVYEALKDLIVEFYHDYLHGNFELPCASMICDMAIMVSEADEYMGFCEDPFGPVFRIGDNHFAVYAHSPSQYGCEVAYAYVGKIEFVQAAPEEDSDEQFEMTDDEDDLPELFEVDEDAPEDLFD